MIVDGLYAKRVTPGRYEIKRPGGTHVIRRDDEATPGRRWAHTTPGHTAPAVRAFRTLKEAVRHVHDNYDAPAAASTANTVSGPLAVVAERVPTPHGGRNGTPWGTAYRLSVNTRPGTWEAVNAWSAGITGLSIVDTDSGWAVVQTHTGIVLGFTVTWESAWRAASRYGFAVADNGLYWDGASATVISLNPACRAACDAIAREHRNL